MDSDAEIRSSYGSSFDKNIAELKAVVELDDETAERLLLSADNDLSKAVEFYFSNPDQWDPSTFSPSASSQPQKTPASASSFSAASASSASSSSSSSSQPNFPPLSVNTKLGYPKSPVIAIDDENGHSEHFSSPAPRSSSSEEFFSPASSSSPMSISPYPFSARASNDVGVSVYGNFTEDDAIDLDALEAESAREGKEIDWGSVIESAASRKRRHSDISPSSYSQATIPPSFFGSSSSSSNMSKVTKTSALSSIGHEGAIPIQDLDDDDLFDMDLRELPSLPSSSSAAYSGSAAAMAATEALKHQRAVEKAAAAAVAAATAATMGIKLPSSLSSSSSSSSSAPPSLSLADRLLDAAEPALVASAPATLPPTLPLGTCSIKLTKNPGWIPRGESNRHNEEWQLNMYTIQAATAEEDKPKYRCLCLLSTFSAFSEMKITKDGAKGWKFSLRVALQSKKLNSTCEQEYNVTWPQVFQLFNIPEAPLSEDQTSRSKKLAASRFSGLSSSSSAASSSSPSSSASASSNLLWSASADGAASSSSSSSAATPRTSASSSSSSGFLFSRNATAAQLQTELALAQVKMSTVDVKEEGGESAASVHDEDEEATAVRGTAWKFRHLITPAERTDFQNMVDANINGLKPTLRNYQRHSVAFMSDQECKPIWTPWVKRYRLTSGHTIYAANVRGCMSLWSHLEDSRGGYLADEMGLGKTVCILALLRVMGCRDKNDRTAAGTLIVAPVSLVGQWKQEIQKHISAQTNLVIWHGSGRDKLAKTGKLGAADIVLTTFSTAAVDLQKPDLGGLNLKWNRIVLDEAHNLTKTGTVGRTMHQLQAKNRWLVSGTPIGTGTRDMDQQIQFLRSSVLLMPGSGAAHDEQISDFFANCGIRHTKAQEIEGESIVKLTKKRLETILVEFSPEERAVYDYFEAKSKEAFIAHNDAGTVGQNYIHFNTLTTKLRQLCSRTSNVDLTTILAPISMPVPPVRIEDVMPRVTGPPLKEKAAVAAEDLALKNSAAFVEEIKRRIQEGEAFECPICLEQVEDFYTIPCGHIFDRDCLVSALRTRPMCPNCRRPSRETDIIRVQVETEEEKARKEEEKRKAAEKEAERLAKLAEEAAAKDVSGKKVSRSVEQNYALATANRKLSSKIAALLRLIKDMAADAKAVVFSQFLETITVVRDALTTAGIKFGYIDGSMPVNKRTKMLEEFNNNPECKIFILTMRTGACGLTLTSAHQLFIIDSCINPAIEQQAINRIHRLGQTKDVIIRRLLMKDSIEERLWKLQAKGIIEPPSNRSAKQPSAKSHEMSYLFGVQSVDDAVAVPRAAGDHGHDDDDIVDADAHLPAPRARARGGGRSRHRHHHHHDGADGDNCCVC